MSELEKSNVVADAVPVKEKIGILTSLKRLEGLLNFKLPDHLVEDMLNAGFDGACKILGTLGDCNQKVVETFTSEYAKYEHEKLKSRVKSKNDIIEYIESNSELTVYEKVDYITEINKFYELEESKARKEKLVIAGVVVLTVGGVATAFVLKKPIRVIGKEAVKGFTKIRVTKIKSDSKVKIVKMLTNTVITLAGK